MIYYLLKLNQIITTDNLFNNALGYSLTNMSVKGDSNFFTDTEIFMNRKNTYFNVNTSFYKNINISNIILQTNKNILNTPSLHIQKN